MYNSDIILYSHSFLMVRVCLVGEIWGGSYYSWLGGRAECCSLSLTSTLHTKTHSFPYYIITNQTPLTTFFLGGWGLYITIIHIYTKNRCMNNACSMLVIGPNCIFMVVAVFIFSSFQIHHTPNFDSHPLIFDTHSWSLSPKVGTPM